MRKLKLKDDTILYILLLAQPGPKSWWPDSNPFLSTFLSLQLFMNSKNYKLTEFIYCIFKNILIRDWASDRESFQKFFSPTISRDDKRNRLS